MFWQLGRGTGNTCMAPYSQSELLLLFLVSDEETEAPPSARSQAWTKMLLLGPSMPSQAQDCIPSRSACRPLTGADLGLSFWKFRWGVTEGGQPGSCFPFRLECGLSPRNREPHPGVILGTQRTSP